MKARKIILASSSPRRKAILKLLGFKLSIAKSLVNEDLLVKKFKKLGPKKLVQILSLAKVISTCYRNARLWDEIIIGFDTIVVCGNKILGAHGA